MATINFRLQSKSDNAPIYLRLNLNAKQSYKRKTGLFIDSKKWTSKNQPNQKDATTKNLASILGKLHTHILDCHNLSIEKNENIDGNWLVKKIDLFFNRSQEDELKYLVDYSKSFVKNLKYKINPKTKKIGVTSATEKKYNTIVNKLIAYDKHTKKRHKITDVNLTFRDDLISYFDEVDGLGDNTIGRYLKFVKTICLDAQKRSQPVHNELEYFQGFTVEAPKVILDIDEIEIIKKGVLSNDILDNARDWLIIGIYTGQRVSDLLRMNTNMIVHLQDFDFIELIQTKTNKKVQIPVHPEVKKILDKRGGEFPSKFADNFESNKTLFNKHLKLLCKKLEINKLVQGNKFNEETKRYDSGTYEKHFLVSSHICRRTFATLHYGNPLYPTPILMNITAHSTEKDFLLYIGKEPLDYSLQLAKTWQQIGLKQKQIKDEQAKLTVIKNASNQN